MVAVWRSRGVPRRSKRGGPARWRVAVCDAPEFCTSTRWEFLFCSESPPTTLRRCRRPLRSALNMRITYGRLVGECETLRTQLKEFGLFELTMDQWLKAPSTIASDAYIRAFDDALSAAGPAGTVSDVRILDPSRPMRYYLGRWTEPRNHDGRFVGRRPQLYGSDLWCYFEIEKGEVRKLVDLPLFGTQDGEVVMKPVRLQAALDAQRGNPQRYPRSLKLKREYIHSGFVLTCTPVDATEMGLHRTAGFEYGLLVFLRDTKGGVGRGDSLCQRQAVVTKSCEQVTMCR